MNEGRKRWVERVRGLGNEKGREGIADGKKGGEWW